jgi:hypothetical protein
VKKTPKTEIPWLISAGLVSEQMESEQSWRKEDNQLTNKTPKLLPLQIQQQVQKRPENFAKKKQDSFHTKKK